MSGDVNCGGSFSGSVKMRSLKYTVQSVVDDDEALAKVPQVETASVLPAPSDLKFTTADASALG